jgi:hypothetical protein
METEDWQSPGQVSTSIGTELWEQNSLKKRHMQRGGEHESMGTVN